MENKFETIKIEEMNNYEQEYWNFKSNLDRTYGDLQHQSALNRLVESEEYNLFSLLKPKISKDGDKFCVLYGDNLQEGIAGFGDTPYLAILDFNKEFRRPAKTNAVHPVFQGIINSLTP